MSRSWCWSLVGLAVAAGCLLPEASVDPSLDEPDPDAKIGTALGGSGGAGGSTTSGVTGGSAGGAAGSDMMPAAGTGGSDLVTQPPPPAAGGSGGGAGGASMNAAGAGGSGMRVPLATCAGSSPEEACGAYCANYEQSCGNFPLAYTYADINDCTQTCNNSSWPVGNITDKGSILCRCYHATLALNNGLTPHCYHAAEMPSMEGGCAP
jgi:hypothetical protein